MRSSSRATSGRIRASVGRAQAPAAHGHVSKQGSASARDPVAAGLLGAAQPRLAGQVRDHHADVSGERGRQRQAGGGVEVGARQVQHRGIAGADDDQVRGAGGRDELVALVRHFPLLEPALAPVAHQSLSLAAAVAVPHLTIMLTKTKRLDRDRQSQTRLSLRDSRMGRTAGRSANDTAPYVLQSVRASAG